MAPAALYVPSGQGVAFTEERGQYEPGGQRRHATKGSPCAKVPAGQGAREAVGVRVPEEVVVREGVAEGVAEGLRDVVPLGVLVLVPEGVKEGVPLCVGVPLLLCVRDGVPEGVMDGVLLREGVMEGVLLRVGVPLTLGVPVPLRVGVAEAERGPKHTVSVTVTEDANTTELYPLETPFCAPVWQDGRFHFEKAAGASVKMGVVSVEPTEGKLSGTKIDTLKR